MDNADKIVRYRVEHRQPGQPARIIDWSDREDWARRKRQERADELRARGEGGTVVVVDQNGGGEVDLSWESLTDPGIRN